MNRRTLLASGAAVLATPGFAMQPLYVPPEEARHQRTFMMWPVNRQVHPDRVFLDMLQDTIADIANTIVEFEPVTMLAHPDDQVRARRRLSQEIELWDIPTEDLWARDAGPLFAKRGDDLVISHIQFNGWGGNQVHRRDSTVAQHIATRLGIPLVPSGLVGEAGGVDHDGHGLIIAHESSWLNDNRNPGLTREDITARLLKAYGANKVIWTKGVYGQDITDYHI